MDLLIKKGDSGGDVDKLAKALAKQLGVDADAFPILSKAGSSINDDFEAAIRRWQAGIGVIADGIVGPRCQVLLGMIESQGDRFGKLDLNVANVSRLFPATKPANIARYLPYIEAALGVAQLTDRAMVIGALGTIRAETEGFVPISEYQSGFNTPPGGVPFSLYDSRLGNATPGDGARYRGRGFVQLTGKSNYQKYGSEIDFNIVEFPDQANAPEVAAVLLAVYLSSNAKAFRAAVAANKLGAARKIVNGGSHGLDNFTSVFKLAADIWPHKVAAGRAGGKRGAGATRRPPQSNHKVSRTKKDTADLRDRLFMPSAISLPNECPSQANIGRFLPAYTKAKMILNQGQEGACTGFGLTCVVNYLRWVRAGLPPTMDSVSPRMLYTLARRYDEYEGENYEGSSCRGAIKGWFHNGVCMEEDGPYAPEKSNPAKYGFATRAAENTLGVYYRIDTKSITDMQAAISQHGAIFVSAFTHDGWDGVPDVKTQPKKHSDVPVIKFDGRPSQDGGHAFALIGFNTDGFILQNSWGNDWGAGGFAVLGYLDWLANGMDAWVVALGVPGVIAGRLAVAQAGQGVRAGADRSKWWDKGLTFQHSVIFGDDGRVSRYLTEDAQPRKLQQQVFALPDQWFRTQPAKAPKRLVIYAHGGLNSEDDAIKRASAMGRFFISNGCYPLFLVWKTGLLESIGDIITGAHKKAPALAGAGEWFTEKTDLLIEKTIGRPFARPIWSEMKLNADFAFAPRRGGDLLLESVQALAASWGDQFELHLVGHSAGSILLGHMLTAMSSRNAVKQALSSVHLYAPACTIAFANKHYASDGEVMKRLHLDVLSDKFERDDNVVSIYRKSLLYFVSNALETDLRTPILGLDCVNDLSYSGWDGSSDTGEALATWRTAAAGASLSKRTVVSTTDRIRTAIDSSGADVMQPAGHGGFDNDIDVITRTLARITAADLAVKVDDLRGY